MHTAWDDITVQLAGYINDSYAVLILRARVDTAAKH